MVRTTDRMVICFLMIIVLLLPLATPSLGELVFTLRSYDIKMGELPQWTESPGGANEFWFEYDMFGSQILFWGWTGPDDVRVMHGNFETDKVLDIPSGFLVNGTRWSTAGSVVVWGSNGTGPGDTILVYPYPTYQLDPSFMPRELLPLLTIDAVYLLAGDEILAVAGRSETGSSQLALIEINNQALMKVLDIDDDLTVQSLGSAGAQLLALDVEGGMTVYETGSWTLINRYEVIEGPFSYSIVVPNVPWVLCGESGEVLLYYWNEGETVEFDMIGSPVYAACPVVNNHSYNLVVALPNDGGGSLIQVYHNFTGDFEVGLEMETEGTVTSIMAHPSDSRNITVGFSDGLVKRYVLWDETKYDVYDPEANKPRTYPHLIPLLLVIGAIISALLVVHRIRNPVS